jgi:hypothetical protein
MYLRSFLTAISCLLIADIFAQSQLTGKIFDQTTDSVLTGITIINVTKKLPGKQEKDGVYNVPASENDVVIFSTVGYKSDTLLVREYMLNTGYDISMKSLPEYLPGITIQAYRSYQQDSIARREYYEQSFKKQKGITGSNAPTNGFGVSVSPLSYFSSEEKQKRKLREKLLREEEQSFVDLYFSRAYVERITDLHDPELMRFMMKYRPSYEFCRKSTREDMLQYINTSLKEFKANPNKKR